MGYRLKAEPLPALQKDLNEDTRTRKPYIGMIADENIRNMARNRSKAVASLALHL